jgi:hypothetical protein
MGSTRGWVLGPCVQIGWPTFAIAMFPNLFIALFALFLVPCRERVLGAEPLVTFPKPLLN